MQEKERRRRKKKKRKREKINTRYGKRVLQMWVLIRSKRTLLARSGLN
jgi:hypothetical protein